MHTRFTFCVKSLHGQSLLLPLQNLEESVCLLAWHNFYCICHFCTLITVHNHSMQAVISQHACVLMLIVSDRAYVPYMSTSLISPSAVKAAMASRPPTQPNNKGKVDKEDFEYSLRKGQALPCVPNGRTQTLKQRPCLSVCHCCPQNYLNDSHHWLCDVLLQWVRKQSQ